MTLIALTLNNIQNGKHGYPVLMGDLLISSPDGDENMPTPTYVNGTREIYADADDKPIGLNQKLYLINDRLCVALGGRVSQMETFLMKLRVIYDTVDFDIDDVSKFVNEFAKEEGNEMFAIILIASEIEKDSYDFQVRCINLFQNDLAQSSRYGTVVAGGSGADQFLKFVQTNALLLSYIFIDTDNGEAKYYRSAMFPRNTFEFSKSPVVFERAENGKLLIYKDQRQDFPMLRTVLNELGYELELKEIN